MSDLTTVETAAAAAYIVAALLFILALAGLSRHETAKAGKSFALRHGGALPRRSRWRSTITSPESVWH
ncbi:hypothetical protein [Streptomyces sp. F001]|uniref:hypothetical protein n=1 Tax=Streptomyces sp. F001 TaxID=1510026 RepID=UPI0013EE6573|nr:hypothetical protein [Streptomyces sp. F001]